MSSVSNTSPTNGSNKTTVKGEPLPKDFFTDHSKVPTNLTSFSISVFFQPIPGEWKKCVMYGCRMYLFEK